MAERSKMNAESIFQWAFDEEKKALRFTNIDNTVVPVANSFPREPVEYTIIEKDYVRQDFRARNYAKAVREEMHNEIAGSDERRKTDIEKIKAYVEYELSQKQPETIIERTETRVEVCQCSDKLAKLQSEIDLIASAKPLTEIVRVQEVKYKTDPKLIVGIIILVIFNLILLGK